MTTKPTIKCTTSELLLILLGHEFNNGGNEFVSFTSRTIPKLNKTDRLTSDPLSYEGVYKITNGTASLKTSYENAVNRELNKTGEQGTFEVGKLPFGQEWLQIESNGQIKTSKIVTVKHEPEGDKYYIRLTFRDKSAPCTSEYFDKNGTVIPKEKLANFLPVEKKVQTVVVESGDEKDIDPVIVRGYGAESITELHLAGKIYQIENP